MILLAQPPQHAIVVASGGLASTMLAYWLHAEGVRVRLLSVDYGQRHRVGLDRAQDVARLLGAEHDVADLSGLSALLPRSVPTDRSVALPEEHDIDARRATIPNQTLLLLGLAVACAVAHKADAVAFGARVGNHSEYPDCPPQFVAHFQEAVLAANGGRLVSGFQTLTPFPEVTTTDVVELGASLGVPLRHTWSCYRGRDVHCGTCSRCTERREAFAEAGVPDPTVYAPEALS